MSEVPQVGLVLSGGAARGAYEAGVLRFLYGDLARRLGRVPWPDVVSGTSVGALNGVFAACRSKEAVDRLCKIWTDLRIEQVYRFAPTLALRNLLGFRVPDPEWGLLDPSPLYDLVGTSFPTAALRAAIGSGATRAFMVSATEVATGFNAVFVDGGVEVSPQPGSRTHRTRIDAVHCRASAAIPFVFPPVRVDGRYHVDGGLRQNTPLRPVLKAGVDRVLVIGLKRSREEEAAQPVEDSGHPSPMFLVGKMLNALMLDPVERDISSAESRNRIVRWGKSKYGESFGTDAAAELGLREVATYHMRPSQDLGRMAGTIYRARPPKTDRAVRWLLDRVAEHTADSEADFLSYLYFDREYTATLEQLGWEDARAAEEELAALVA
jgi:NTE family protein